MVNDFPVRTVVFDPENVNEAVLERRLRDEQKQIQLEKFKREQGQNADPEAHPITFGCIHLHVFDAEVY